ncbi:MAG TPA: hypothetical protein VK912_15515 [Longimicrobiales bacterium]|nr:hypothetical protein [Longimicrobiales bacterium]
MNMEPNPARWHRVQEIFHVAIAVPAQERSNYIAQVCDGDPDLRAEVEQLLRREEQAVGEAGSRQ